jgi:hypothetical protein
MTTPAKFLKKPATDLSELEPDALNKLAGGTLKRTLKLVRAAEDRETTNAHLLAFLRACATIFEHDRHLAGAVVQRFYPEAGHDTFSLLIDLATTHKDDEDVSKFLVGLKAALIKSENGERDAFLAACDDKEEGI